MTFNRIKQNFVNIPGWTTQRKIVVIESDDWGSVRMSSKDAIAKLTEFGHDFEKDLYGKYDSLASEEDLTALFEVLHSVKDKNGRPAVLTANANMANPDFKKIKECNFQEYHYEIFTDTLKKYPKHGNAFQLWQEGMQHQVFHPQFHGREHVNVLRWLRALSKGDELIRAAFDFEIFGLKQIKSENLRDGFMRALDYENESQFDVIKQSLIDGAKIFKEKFGYSSKSFIAPSYVWDAKVEEVLNDLGIRYLQGIRYQYQPELNKQELQKKIHFLGQKNKLKQRYLIRNAFFEPTLLGKSNTIENVLKSMQTAFFWNKPVILSTHRINFIGFLNEQNRNKNLILLQQLLQKIIHQWPNVEFMTSDRLGDLINVKEKKGL